MEKNNEIKATEYMQRAEFVKAIFDKTFITEKCLNNPKYESRQNAILAMQYGIPIIVILTIMTNQVLKIPKKIIFR